MSSERTPKKVALIGFAESWKLAPWDDPTVEFWALNEFWKYAPRWDRWFEVHDSDTLGVTNLNLGEGEAKRHLEWLAKDHGPNKPIYMRSEFCDGRFPNAVPLPIDVLSKVSKAGRYYTSSIAYMLGLAIHEGYDWIGMYGIDLANDREYVYERPCAEYYTGLAEGKGITVEIAPTAALCKAGHLYGLEKDPGELPIFAHVKAHRARLAAEHEKQLATLNTLDGAMQECDNFLKMPQYLERGVTIQGY